MFEKNQPELPKPNAPSRDVPTVKETSLVTSIDDRQNCFASQPRHFKATLRPVYIIDIKKKVERIRVAYPDNIPWDLTSPQSSVRGGTSLIRRK